MRRAFCLSNRYRSTPWWPVPQICGRLQAQLCEVHKWGICGDDSFRNWGMSLLSMRSDSPIEIVRFRRDALLGVIRRREWMMFLWVLTHCCRPSIERVEIPISIIAKPPQIEGERYSKSIAIIVTPAVPCGNSLSRSLILAGSRSSWMTGQFDLFL